MLYVGGKFYWYNYSTRKIVCYPYMWTTCDSIYNSNDLPNLGISTYDYKGNPYNDVDLNYDETGKRNLLFWDYLYSEFGVALSHHMQSQFLH